MINLTFIIGQVLCWGLVVFGIFSGGTLEMFIDIPSVAITFGGSLGATFAQTPMSDLKNFGTWFKIAIVQPRFLPKVYIEQLVEFAGVARSKGLLALEESANGVDDPFLKQALMLIVDANDPEKVREMLENAADATSARHQAGIGFFGTGMSMGPAFGMIGTLVGLVIMLNGMQANPDGLGEAMATAIITTFYGSLEANVIFAPIKSALDKVDAAEQLCMSIVIEGVMAIAAGSNPRLIQEKLESMIAPSLRTKDDRGR
ncbi:motility protein A [Clostridia bacterium]|nr:motility protein A [Clostridia bacterium]